MADNDRLDRIASDNDRSSRAKSGDAAPAADGAQRVSTALDTNGEGRDRPKRHVPERRCILTGAHGERADLIRLALGPDGQVAPDVRARAPGRGAWIGVDKPALAAALAKGKLRAALARAFKTGDVTVPADLPDRVEAALARDALDRLGMEAKAGTLVTGSDRIVDHARKGQVALLLHAADASADGNRKLDQALRVGLDEEGSGARGLVIPADRTTLSLALGRENVVHAALIAPAAAARVARTLGRWRGFIGRQEGSEPCDNASQGPSALTK
ncbi:DUF448 domain-containing protein [Sphingomonas sp. 1P06PA]